VSGYFLELGALLVRRSPHSIIRPLKDDTRDPRFGQRESDALISPHILELPHPREEDDGRAVYLFGPSFRLRKALQWREIALKSRGTVALKWCSNLDEAKMSVERLFWEEISRGGAEATVLGRGGHGGRVMGGLRRLEEGGGPGRGERARATKQHLCVV